MIDIALLRAHAAATPAHLGRQLLLDAADELECSRKVAAPTEPTGAQADEQQIVADLRTIDNVYGRAPTEFPRKTMLDAALLIESLQRNLEAARGIGDQWRKERDEYLVGVSELLASNQSLQRELDIVWRSNAGLTTDVLELRAQLEAATGERDEWKKNCSLLTHQLITCGVAASHPDATLSSRGKDYGGPWDSPQAQQVRTLRADRDQLRAQLASAEAEIGNIAHAKRFDRAIFWSDTEFADWAQSRCHAALSHKEAK